METISSLYNDIEKRRDVAEWINSLFGSTGKSRYDEANDFFKSRFDVKSFLKERGNPTPYTEEEIILWHRVCVILSECSDIEEQIINRKELIDQYKAKIEHEQMQCKQLVQQIMNAKFVIMKTNEK
jgi:hypothetical protein